MLPNCRSIAPPKIHHHVRLNRICILDKLNKQTDFDLPDGFFYMLVVGILLGFAGPLVDINIGNTAHISGLLVGMLLAFWDRNIRVKS